MKGGEKHETVLLPGGATSGLAEDSTRPRGDDSRSNICGNA